MPIDARPVPAEPTALPPRGLAARVRGVLTAPRTTYAAVAARPQAIDVLVLVALTMSIATLVFQSTTVGRQALVDRQVRSLEALDGSVTDARYERLQRLAPIAGYAQAGAELIGVPLAAAALAAILRRALGGSKPTVSFAQTFAIVAHSAVILGLRQLFVLPIAYVRESLSSPVSLTALFPLLPDDVFASYVLGSVDLFAVWWIASLAIGLGVLYRRRTGRIAVALLAAYAMMAAALIGFRISVARL